MDRLPPRLAVKHTQHLDGHPLSSASVPSWLCCCVFEEAKTRCSRRGNVQQRAAKQNMIIMEKKIKKQLQRRNQVLELVTRPTNTTAERNSTRTNESSVARADGAFHDEFIHRQNLVGAAGGRRVAFRRRHWCGSRWGRCGRTRAEARLARDHANFRLGWSFQRKRIPRDQRTLPLHISQ